MGLSARAWIADVRGPSVIDDSKPSFLQIAQMIESDIVDHVLTVLVGRRCDDFYDQYVSPLAREARKPGIDGDQLAQMLAREPGAVKTTLMSILTAQGFASTGTESVFGQPPMKTTRY